MYTKCTNDLIEAEVGVLGILTFLFLFLRLLGLFNYHYPPLLWPIIVCHCK